MTTEPEKPRITPDPDRDGGVILRLPDVTHIDTQVWSVDVGLTGEALAGLREALAAAAPAVSADQAAVTPPPALTEAGRLRAQIEVLQQDAERDRGLAKVGARCMRDGHQGLIEGGRATIEGHRFALSVKLDLGTSAPWDAIYERVAVLRRLAAEAHDGDTQDDAAAADLPDRLAAVLTERFTELGNPFSRMRIAFQGPDGWPATEEVGPHDVAEVLRELMPAASAVPLVGSAEPDSGEPSAVIPCPDAFWLKTTHAAHGWQQGPDVKPVHCPGIVAGEARAVPCTAVALRVHHALHDWAPQPGMDPVRCAGYPQDRP